MSGLQVILLLAVAAFSTTSAIPVAEVDDISSTLGNRIVNGTLAPEGAFPYQVALRLNNKHNCGGSILNDRWILTAAHCVRYINDNEYTVITGTNNANGVGGASYQSVKVISHKYFDPNSLMNDIGLIKVNESIKFNDRTRPVKLPALDMDKNNYPATISGWGRLSENSQLPDKLHYVSTYLMDQKSCGARLGEVNLQVTDRTICSYTRHGQGICFGDSGGPLTADGVQVGVVSYVVYTCAIGYPDVYTRVWPFLDWIEEQTALY